MEPYQPRILDRPLRELAAELPAILIEGAKAVGKTSTALYFLSTGAYTASYASVGFNGFLPIKTYIMK
ncbi:hypothetical protein AGMMS49944_18950 [Spirochaetia bacterium]|nr:hypothetical protein AGMMS49944_18950 [Spirochaetia bacterium]